MSLHVTDKATMKATPKPAQAAVAKNLVKLKLAKHGSQENRLFLILHKAALDSGTGHQREAERANTEHQP